MTDGNIQRGNMRKGKFYRITNKRLDEEFIVKYMGGRERMVYLYWRNTPKHASKEYLGECEFPFEEGDVEVEIKEDEVFMEVI